MKNQTMTESDLILHELGMPFPGQNGEMELYLPGGKHTIMIHGGPFKSFIDGPGRYGLCLREDKPVKATAHMPIQDFSIPEQPVAEVQKHIRALIAAAIHGVQVYVGCAGGWGRTGIMLALVAKTLGYALPITHVRANYSRHAVEKPAQEAYIDQFPVEDLKWFIRWHLFTAWLERTLASAGKPNAKKYVPSV